jgi:hypothetical protein
MPTPLSNVNDWLDSVTVLTFPAYRHILNRQQRRQLQVYSNGIDNPYRLVTHCSGKSSSLPLQMLFFYHSYFLLFWSIGMAIVTGWKVWNHQDHYLPHLNVHRSHTLERVQCIGIWALPWSD